MKEITKNSRLAQQLEKIFNMLNTDFFDSKLNPVVIIVHDTYKSYGRYIPYDVWDVKGIGQRCIIVGAGVLDKPIDVVVSTLLHAMVHYYDDAIDKIQDCSRGYTYHNKYFKKSAESHGLIVTHDDTYGWSHTKPSEKLIKWIADNRIQDILICRNYNSSSKSIRSLTTNSRRYECPFCGLLIRATKSVNVICADCMAMMVESNIVKGNT